MANSGLPGTSGFVGEFMVILSSFQLRPWVAFTAAITLILGAGYTLWLTKRVLWGDVTNDKVQAMTDINWREAVVLVSFAAGVLWLGVYPKPLTDMMDPAIAQLVAALAHTKI